MKIHIHRLHHFFVTTTAVILIVLSQLLESSAMTFISTPTLKLLSSFPLSKSLSLHILKGSVVEFATSCPQSSAIVNAANEGCLGGGGVDGAITVAGGEDLARDRLALPVLRGGVRCFTGNAVVTGPNQNGMNYGSLAVPYVIHAVGPNFWDFDEAETDMAEQLLQKAYQASLERAREQGISHVAFSLLSAGIFRGPDLSVRDILRLAVEGIQKWAVDECRTIDTIDDDDDDEETEDAAESALTSTLDQEQQQRESSLQHIYLCGFTTAEVKTLQEVCHEILGEPMDVEDEAVHSDINVEEQEEENQPVEAAEEKQQTETLKSRLVARERSESFPSDEEDGNTATGVSAVHGPSSSAKITEIQHGEEDTEEKEEEEEEATTTMNTCTQTTETEETNGKSPAKRPKM